MPVFDRHFSGGRGRKLEAVSAALLGPIQGLVSTIDMNGNDSGTRVRGTPVACNGVS